MRNNINSMQKVTLRITLIIMFCIAARSQAQSWTPLGSGTNSYVRALQVFHQDLFVGGDFVSANSHQHNRVGIWNNSNAWVKADSNISWVSTRCFCVYNDELYAGRDFGVSKWDGDQWITTNAPTSQVFEMAVYKNELYAVGQGNVRKWNGTSWSNVGFPNTDVNSVCVYNGELIIAGAFTDISGVAYNHIAKWNGSNWTSLGIGILGGTVDKVRTYKGELFVSGSFYVNQGNASDYLTKWNGSNWSVAIPNMNNSVTAMDSANGNLYLAVNGDIAAWNGSTLNPFRNRN